MVDGSKNELTILAKSFPMRIIGRLTNCRTCRRYVGVHQLLADVHRCYTCSLTTQAPESRHSLRVRAEVALYYHFRSDAQPQWSLRINSAYYKAIDRRFFDLHFGRNVTLCLAEQEHKGPDAPRHSFKGDYILLIAWKAIHRSPPKCKWGESVQPESSHKQRSEPRTTEDSRDSPRESSLPQHATARPYASRDQFYAPLSCRFEDHCQVPLFSIVLPRYRASKEDFVPVDSVSEAVPSLRFLASPDAWLPDIELMYCPAKLSPSAEMDSMHSAYDRCSEPRSDATETWLWDPNSTTDFLAAIS
ncbi:hypothetical protein GLOTRDRAFT_120876 [Gloeophyllum trabeum ATCC 11539]|uniref:Uncharacterized protein n=1 Tax=Gloeophyllum trabeum (strain ATCC 11539 / FP-39264 / Madison 617) TaxID=670483 RepID=S7Q9Y3_GLOTA|nr:uncharacterized protein GLOTRDRAFT_120876 [Gloeophyllum trabeum ATCC 11539]EPQ56327.1 hypothetical protein GLOTRDRAFT_120876 [Gloeophyllum trabeum ATCC 11539]